MSAAARSLSIVVPAHGPAAQVAPLLESLGAQARASAGPPLVVFLVDDTSPVPLADGVPHPDGLDLHVLRRAQNGGPGAARNTGLAEVTTPWVAFLDADTVPDPTWLARAEHDVQQPGAADMVEGTTRIPADRPPSPFTHATEAAPPEQHVAGNILLRTEVLRGAGGFDERYYDPDRRLHFREDAALAFRLEEAGATIEHDPELLVDHPPLPSSFWSPVKLARRYFFDPQLARDHPERFRAMNGRRRIGPVTLRRARHDACVAYVLGLVLLVVGLLTWWPLALVGGLLALAGWLGTAVALCWRKRVTPAHVVPVLVVSLLVPFVYLWHWWRGVLRFRHRPRL